MRLKVCGMKFIENMEQVAALQPDYMGFIFYEKSKRNFEGIIPELPNRLAAHNEVLTASKWVLLAPNKFLAAPDGSSQLLMESL